VSPKNKKKSLIIYLPSSYSKSVRVSLFCCTQNKFDYILQNLIFCVQQNKETHTDLEQLEGE